MRHILAVVLIATSVPLITACSGDRPATTDSSAEKKTWTVTKIVDGDTLWVVDAAGAKEKVRIIGIDTPESNECGFDEAAEALANLIGANRVGLVPGAPTDRDRYGRLLRYVDVGDVDAGLKLIESGLAIARYDSRDGYGAHHREAVYVRADGESPVVCGR